MELFTIELVSIAFAQLFQYNTLSTFTKFSPEQMNQEGPWEVAISQISYPSLYKNITEGKVMFFDRKLSKSSKFYYLEPGFYPSIMNIVEAMNSLIQERHNHSENCITVKLSGRTKNLRFALQVKDLVLHSLVWIWDSVSEVISVMNLE